MDMPDSKASFVRHVPCPECGSSDANAEYTDESQYCFSCETYTPPEKHGSGTASASTFPTASSAKQKATLLKGEVKAIPARGLTEETCRKFGYLTGHHNGEPVQIAVYRDAKGKPVAQKLRTADKRFQIIGDGKNLTLWGSHLWSKGKKLVVAEGEICAATISQVQSHKWATVSLPNGAPSAVKAIKQNWEYLENFEEIILMFDMDEVGQKAAREVAEILPVGKAKIARLPCKDANECLQRGKAGEIIEAIFQAKEYRPDGIVAATDYREVICVDDAASSISYPYSMLNRILRGIRKRELVTVCAGSGVGKTTFVRELIYHLHQSGQRVGCIMLEESNKRTVLGILGTHLNKNLTLDRSDVSDEEMLAGFDDLFNADGRNPVYLYDHWGSTDVDVICNKLIFLAKSCSVDFIVLDHLAILISQTAIGTDERKLVDYAMTRLRSICEENNIGMILVQHLRRPDGNRGHEAGHQVRLSDLRSSHSVAQLSDACIALNVDPEFPDSDVRHLSILKNRFTGETSSNAGTLVYDRSTGRLIEEHLAALLEEEESKDGSDDTAETTV